MGESKGKLVTNSAGSCHAVPERVYRLLPSPVAGERRFPHALPAHDSVHLFHVCCSDCFKTWHFPLNLLTTSEVVHLSIWLLTVFISFIHSSLSLFAFFLLVSTEFSAIRGTEDCFKRSIEDKNNHLDWHSWLGRSIKDQVAPLLSLSLSLALVKGFGVLLCFYLIR